MNKIDIKNLSFNSTEVGGFVKSSKIIFTWEFIIDNAHHKIELSHSRLKGKRVVLVDGREVSNSFKFTYSYTFSFPLDKHFFTIIQITPDNYDLRIDNISFNNLQLNNRNRKNKYKSSNDSYNVNNDDDFDFGDSKTNKNSNVNIGNQKKK